MEEQQMNQQKEREVITLADRFLIAMFLPKDYHKILSEKFGKLVQFMLVLLFLIAFTRYAIPGLAKIAGYGGIGKMMKTAIPTFSLENGELELDDRYEVADDVSSIYVVADTSVKEYTKEDVPSKYVESIMISQTNILVYNKMNISNGGIQITKFSDFGPMKLDNGILAKQAPIIYFSLICTWVFLFIMESIKYICMGLFYSIFMYLYANAIVADVSFGKILKSSMFAQAIGALVYAITCCVESPVLIFAASIFQILITISIMRRVIIFSRRTASL